MITIGVFSHEVYDGSVRDKDERLIFLSKCLQLRKNTHLESCKDYKSVIYESECFCSFCLNTKYLCYPCYLCEKIEIKFSVFSVISVILP